MNTPAHHPIGIPGQPWGMAEKAAWFQAQSFKRSYKNDVLDVVETLRSQFKVVQYGHLDHDPVRYPLFAIENQNSRAELPNILITGGVHGYETSGVHGALAFATEHALAYEAKANLFVVPCVSPWAYEVIHRWNNHAVDPNRSFVANGPAQESSLLMQYVASLGVSFAAHIDLHETTDSDESEFRPVLAARDGLEFTPGEIPDGFYLVDDSENQQPEFQQAIIEAVAKVTHIAPPDQRGEIIGSPVVANGVINYPLKALGLCASVTEANYTTTTEVYPDSLRATPAQCTAAQVAAVSAAIDYALATHSKGE